MRNHSKFFRWLVGLGGALALSPEIAAFEYGDPTPFEQLQLEVFNRSRSNPQLTASQLKIDLNEGLTPGTISNQATQPLSFNAQLLSMAHIHSEDMLQGHFLSHTNLQGENFTDRLKINNYPYEFASEGLDQVGSTLGLDKVHSLFTFHNNLFYDQDSPDRSKRLTLLNPAYQEIGLGIAFGIWQEDQTRYNSALFSAVFATRKNARPIILGVVFDDRDNNHFYDVGEGIANVSVSISVENLAQTASAGGFGIEVAKNNIYTLTFSHPTYGSVVKTVTVNQQNVKVDVLKSEFSTTVPQECSTLAQDILTIPCIQSNNQTYKVKLAAINFSPVQFGVQYFSDQGINSLVKCENFDSKSLIADLKCVQIGSQRYWAKLNLLNDAAKGPVFEVQSYGTVP